MEKEEKQSIIIRMGLSIFLIGISCLIMYAQMSDAYLTKSEHDFCVNHGMTYLDKLNSNTKDFRCYNASGTYEYAVTKTDWLGNMEQYVENKKVIYMNNIPFFLFTFGIIPNIIIAIYTKQTHSAIGWAVAYLMALFISLCFLGGYV